MSDVLNERFEELVKQQEIIREAQDPMPTVSASVIPATGKEPSQISDVQTAKAGGKDPQPSVPPTVAIGQKPATDLGGTTTTPHSHDEDGEENPGAKAAAPIASKGTQSDGTAQTANIHDAGDQGTTPTVGTQVAYGTSTGPNVTYPIKPSFEELDVTSDVAALTEGEELSEDYKTKAKTIFEAAVKSKLQEEYAKLEEQFETKLAEQVEAIKTELSEEVQGLVNYGVGQWIEENQVAIDRGIRNEITEDFIAGFMNLCKEHWISIPEDKANVVDEMADELREMEERLNEQIERNVELNNRLAESSKVVILNQVSEGLADTQKEKLASLSEGVRFETVEQFTEAVKTLRKSYFPESITKSEVSDDSPVTLSEDVSPVMAAYVQAISRWK
jgi:hypothetical protein